MGVEVLGVMLLIVVWDIDVGGGKIWFGGPMMGYLSIAL